MNEWMKWMNEAINESMNEWMNETVNEMLNDWMNERNEWNKGMIEWMK